MAWDRLERLSDDEAKDIISLERMAYLLSGNVMAPRSVPHCFRIYRSATLEKRFNSVSGLVGWLSGCHYEHDWVVFEGRRDVWLHPEDFERERLGDCEDFALYAWLQLLAMGYRAYFVVGIVDRGHAWVVYEDRGLRLFEATAGEPHYKPRRLIDEPRYQVCWAVDGDLAFFQVPGRTLRGMMIGGRE